MVNKQKDKSVPINVGSVFPTNEGGEVEVLSIISWHKVEIKHLDYHGHIRNVEFGDLRKGRIKNPFHPSVQGVGYLGLGEYKATMCNKRTPAYTAWSSMLTRVYSSASIEKKNTYRSCSVVKQWHNFQNFAEWYYQQPNAGEKGFHLDKDLTVIGNKEYGPNTCNLIPYAVNILLIDSAAIRGTLPIGVKKTKNGFQARVKKYGELCHLGTFGTAEEAHIRYREEKSKHVRVIAEEYKHLIHRSVYENLIKWGVNATGTFIIEKEIE